MFEIDYRIELNASKIINNGHKYIVSHIQYFELIKVLKYIPGSDINLLYQHQTPDEMLQLLIKEKQWFVYIEELLMRMESLMHANIANTNQDNVKSCRHVLWYWKTSLESTVDETVSYVAQ